ncbi:Rrf2 family transcriptional regulator [Lysinibacillus macroides]|uniref:Rrf2 family transcriptional regulator n=1 Tax=Lysinibacillus macroides TaxID=33935 RepID=A0A0M9DHK0_9BACI|nr:Rrf2 family transcriptional regulator [Lysinibacillus macroides]KOY80302.1 Rrf2 family transcriptional regulator [Lysinibacillus macroides]QPR67611.1 Rrf2 family transcriptional regulator [Lysinibacillus macroides]
MKYSKATNYALHTMVILALTSQEKSISVESLAEMQSLSSTYLSKILTKLVKAGLIVSNPGVNGGYRISKHPQEISFLDVIYAIEGQTSLFSCSSEHKDSLHKEGCLIEQVMIEAENNMKKELGNRYIIDIAKQVKEKGE